MENFTPVSGLIGGLLIGLAASALVLLNGRTAGISNILGGSFTLGRDNGAWRLAFLAGLVIGPWLVAAARGAAPEITMQASMPWLIGAGLLVGFGTQLSNGCTSGHGVCGIARGRKRSFVATLVFIAAAAAVVFVMRHGLGG